MALIAFTGLGAQGRKKFRAITRWSSYRPPPSTLESQVELTRTPTPWYRLPKCFDKLSDTALRHCRVGHLAVSRA